MHLETDVTFDWKPCLRLGPSHDLHTVDPSRDGRLVASSDAHLELVPAIRLPKGLPLLRRHRHRLRGAVGSEGDFALGLSEVEETEVRLAAQSFAVETHEAATGMEIDESLVTLAVLGAAKEEPAIRAEVVVHLQRDLELGILRVRQDDAAIARYILRASERAVHDLPVATGFIVAGAAMAGLGTDMPAFQGLAIED